MFDIALQPLARGDGLAYRPRRPDGTPAPVTIPGQAAPYDLTGATLTWEASLSKGGAAAITKTTAAGIALDDQTLNPASPTAGAGRGWFTLTLAHADTAALAPSPLPVTLYWSLKLSDGAYEDATLCSGTLPVVSTPTS